MPCLDLRLASSLISGEKGIDLVFSLLSVNKFKRFLLNFPYKQMANASSCTVELWMHLGDVLGGLLSSQELAKYNLLTASACSMRICSTLALLNFIRRIF